jgi:hypothetical protein
MLLALALRLRWGRRKIPGLLLVLKTCGLMGPVAEGLVCGVAAAAERDGFTASEAV